jgi:hypothetical protein
MHGWIAEGRHGSGFSRKELALWACSGLYCMHSVT